MRDAAGEPADSLQTLRLLQCLLPPDFVGDVANEGDVAEVIATLMTQNSAGDDSGERGLILALERQNFRRHHGMSCVIGGYPSHRLEVAVVSVEGFGGDAGEFGG